MPEVKPEAGLTMLPARGAAYSVEVDTTITAKGAVRLDLANNQPAKGTEQSPRYPNFKVHCEPPKGAKYQRARVRFSDPEIEITAGWVYLTGSAPAARTPRIRAGGIGTVIVVECDDKVDRVYLLSAGSSVEIYAPPNAASPSYILSAQNDYVEVDGEANVVNPPGLYPDDAARNDFIVNTVLPSVDGL